jgi:ABC-type transport system substrate-binding protein
MAAVTAEVSERSSSTIAQQWVFESLAAFDERGELKPRLASRIELVDRGKLRVWLRPAAFSDGTALTEADVVRSLTANHLRAVPAGDALEIETDDASAPLDQLLVRAYVSRPSAEGDLGTGPFVVVSQTSEQVVLRRRPSSKGDISEIVLRSFASDRDAFIRTLRGEADVLRLTDGYSVDFFEGMPRTQIVRGPGPGVHAAAFNPRRLGKEERAGLVRALRVDTISAAAYGEGCVPVPSLATGQPLPPGRRLDILATSNETKLALAIRRALGPRGGEIRSLELGAYFDALKAGDYDLAIARPLVWPPSAAGLIWRSGSLSNYVGYSNPAVDAALDRWDWAAARHELELDPPAVFFCTQQRVVVVDARVADPHLGRFEVFDSLADWRMSP